MVYPEEPFWVLPTVTGFYEDRDYRGEFDLCLFFFLSISINQSHNSHIVQ